MGSKDARIDAYIGKSPDFAKPILEHIRDVVHKASPLIDETIKWSMPAFEYKGTVAQMAAFKAHCSFILLKADLIEDKDKVLKPMGEGAMGNLGQVKTLKDLPKDKQLINLIKQVIELNEKGIKKTRKEEKVTRELVIPDYFTKEIKKNKEALKHFNNFSESKKREYIEWITEAKTDKTKTERLTTSIEWISEGKPRMWKYDKKWKM